MLEGPRQETASQAKRAKGKLADGTVGWVTFSADKGAEHFSPAKDIKMQTKYDKINTVSEYLALWKKMFMVCLTIFRRKQMHFDECKSHDFPILFTLMRKNYECW